MITFLALSIVALKLIFDPLRSESFKVIKLSTFESVSRVSLVFLIASLKVSVILEAIAILSAESIGSKIMIGGLISAAVKIIELAVITLSELSSTIGPMAT